MIKLTKHDKFEIWMDSSDASGDEFYRRMGKFFADRSIRKELEEPLSDGPGFRWVIAYKSYTIVGFACLNAEHVKLRNEAWLTYAYVMPDYRKLGLHSALFEERITLAKRLGASSLRGVANENSYQTFIRHGFQIDRTKGRFTYFSKDI